jgi:beta-1,2-mannosidase
VLRPAAPPWMEAGAFNPAAVMVNGKTVLLFRARDARGTSRIGYAESADGLHFKIDPGRCWSPPRHTNAAAVWKIRACCASVRFIT